MRITYVYNEEWEKDYVKSRIPEHSLSFLKAPLEDSQSRDEDTEVLSVFVNSHISATEMDRFPKLRFISARSTGFDHIDVAEAHRRGIVVSNVPSYGENTVAEFAFALLLALSRKIYDSYHRIAEKGSFSQDGLRGFDLKGKTFGVVGTGRIGRHAIKMAKGFDMNVVAYDPFPNNETAQALSFEYLSLEDLLSRSDIISLHAPYNEHTHHLINTGNIEKIKRGAYLINTARGGLIETVALVKALEEGIVAGAGLDVLEEEGYMGDEIHLLVSPHPKEEDLRILLSNHYFIDHPRVIITPHNAFNTQEAIERILNTTAENIKAFVNGAPINIIK
ncbi:MAG: hydroxyacid dehydrogenase [bacterium]|nr:hydroxyacid dehydrogenase [bacterium]